MKKLFTGLICSVLISNLANALLSKDETVEVMTGKNTGKTTKPENDPKFKPIESHYLTFPIIETDYAKWLTKEDAVFLKNKIIIAPEAAGSSGYLEALLPNPIKETWVARIDFKIARDKFKRKDWMNGDGLAIYYLKTIPTEPPKLPNYYGYYDDFDGVGVFITPKKSEKYEGPVRKVQI